MRFLNKNILEWLVGWLWKVQTQHVGAALTGNCDMQGLLHYGLMFLIVVYILVYQLIGKLGEEHQLGMGPLCSRVWGFKFVTFDTILILGPIRHDHDDHDDDDDDEDADEDEDERWAMNGTWEVISDGGAADTNNILRTFNDNHYITRYHIYAHTQTYIYI